MPEHYEEIFRKFIKDRLGGLAGDRLLVMHMEKLGIPALSSLDQRQLIKFADYFIYEVFHNHLTRDEIDAIRLQLNLYFCFQKASEKISKMVNTDIYLHPLKIKIEPKYSFDMILNSLTKDLTAITITLTGSITGRLLFFIFKESAINLSHIMIRTMLNQTPEGTDLDELKESAIKEFMNIMIPTFLGTISSVLGKDIRYHFSDYKLKDFAIQIGESLAYSNLEENGTDKVKKILSADIALDIEDKSIQGICFFMLENEDASISTTLSRSHLKKGNASIDIDISRLSIRPNLPTKEKMIALIDYIFPGQGQIIIENTMSSLSIGGFSNLSLGIKSQFIANIITRHMSEYSDQAVDYVRNTLGDMLGIEFKNAHIGPVKDSKVDKDVLARMLREGAK